MAPTGTGVRSGPPAPHLATTPAVQLALSARPGWHAFQARWPGDWVARWDERNGTPRFLGAPGVATDDAESLAHDVARLAGVHPDELVDAGAEKRGQRGFRRWTRRWRGAEVFGDEVLL